MFEGGSDRNGSGVPFHCLVDRGGQAPAVWHANGGAVEFAHELLEVGERDRRGRCCLQEFSLQGCYFVWRELYGVGLAVEIPTQDLFFK